MRKIFFCVLLALSISSVAQTDSLKAQKCFVEAPADVLPLLSEIARLDMIDYFTVGSTRTTPNEYGGESIITSLEPSKVCFDGSARMHYQMIVIDPDSKTPTIGLIATIDTPIPDSNISLFTSSWDKKDAFDAPQLSDWLTAAGKKQRSDVEGALPYVLATYDYDPSAGILTVKHQMHRYFALGEGDKILALLKPELRYKWDGKRFKLVKQ